MQERHGITKEAAARCSPVSEKPGRFDHVSADPANAPPASRHQWPAVEAPFPNKRTGPVKKVAGQPIGVAANAPPPPMHTPSWVHGG